MTAIIELRPGWQPVVKAPLWAFKLSGHFAVIEDDLRRTYLYACQSEAEAATLARSVDLHAKPVSGAAMSGQEKKGESVHVTGAVHLTGSVDEAVIKFALMLLKAGIPAPELTVAFAGASVGIISGGIKDAKQQDGALETNIRHMREYLLMLQAANATKN